MARETEMKSANERLKHNLRGAVQTMHTELERIEILAAAFYGFSAPVPEYEPTFQHLPTGRLTRHEIGERDARYN